MSNQEQEVQPLHEKNCNRAGYSDDLKIKFVAVQKKRNTLDNESSDSDVDSEDEGA